MMKAITVKYLGPTDHKGTRLKAYDCSGNQLTVARDYEQNVDDQSQEVAEAFVVKMGWFKPGAFTLKQGAVKEGYVHVFV